MSSSMLFIKPIFSPLTVKLRLTLPSILLLRQILLEKLYDDYDLLPLDRRPDSSRLLSKSLPSPTLLVQQHSFRSMTLSSENPTPCVIDGSAALHKKSRIPPTAVGGYLKSSLLQDASQKPARCRASKIRQVFL